MSDNTVIYFAYGSNMDEEQMRKRCPGAKCRGTAVLPDHKFALDSEGYATVIPCKDKQVRGVIWEISSANEKALDWYEGFAASCYSKQMQKVSPEGHNSAYPAMLYVSLRGTNNGERKDGYIERIVYAAKKHGFDSSYLGMLKDIWVGYANEDVRHQNR